MLLLKDNKTHCSYCNSPKQTVVTLDNRLLTAAVGINAEGGEFMEIVKKITFQGKPWDEANLDHLKIEMGDVMWYVAQACMALDISLEEVMDRNIDKLFEALSRWHL